MAGRTGIVKNKKRKQVLDKDYLYGKWSKDMDEDELGKGVDEAQAAGAAALTPKYKGRKSDLAFIEAQKKKKLAAEKKKKKRQLKKRDKDFMTREIKSGPRNEKVESRTPYKIIKGEDYVASKKKKKKKRVGRTMY